MPIATGRYEANPGTLADGTTKQLLLDSSGKLVTAAGGTGTSADQVQGNVAHDAADAGSPVKTGGYASSTVPSAVTTGDRVNGWFNLNGAQVVSAFIRGATTDGGNDAISAAVVTYEGLASVPRVRNELFNSGTTTGTWDVQRGNFNTAALITATGATTSQTGADQTNHNGRGVQVVLDMTNAGTGSVTITIQGKDAASGKYYTLLAGAAVTTNSTNVYTVYPGAPTTANVSASLPVPRTWRVIVTVNNANATTYTVGASVIL